VERHGLGERITLAQGNGFAAAPGVFDLILCNPPYVNAGSMARLPAEFRAEPALALQGGSDGMDFIRPLIRQARQHLSDHGVLVLEIGHERDHFHRAFPRLPAVGLPTSLGDDAVLLIQAEDLP
jgi:ribosomal protein L3 glutamine methyltransferase